MKTTEEREADETSPNHTWTPDCGTSWKHRVQWRKDKSRNCIEQFKAGVAMRERMEQVRNEQHYF